MGLCKCPKRQVTNQFCFEHCVNVCENCMVTSHPKCIVQSYLNWLKDSDFVSICSLCNGSLEDGDCVRLICYHIFHWSCLDERQSALQITTTTSGTHTCPVCFEAIFPPTNLVSPVADILRVKLKQVEWAKNNLGENAFSESVLVKSNPQNVQGNQVTKIHYTNIEKTQNNEASTFYNNNSQIASNSPHSVLLMDAFNPPASSDFSNNRRSLLSRQSNGGTDRDDNKYRRRTPAEIFSRWSRRFYAPSSRPPWRRTWFLVLFGFISFVIIVYLMAHFGRNTSNNESNDYWDNPNPNAMQVQNDHY